jgi:hypothetical protein
MEKEDQKCLLIIGGIEIFLPLSPVEVRACVVDTTSNSRRTTSCDCQKRWSRYQRLAQAKEKEHSEEWLKSFSQEAEKETTAALKLTAKEEHADKILTPWELELEMLEDWLSHPEPVDDCHEQTVMQMLAEEHSEESLRNFSQGDEQMMMTAMPRYASRR